MAKAKKKQQNTEPELFDYVSKKWTDVKEGDEICLLDFHIFKDITEWHPCEFECYPLKITKVERFYDSNNPECTPDKVHEILRAIEFTFHDEGEPEDRDAYGAFCVYRGIGKHTDFTTNFLGTKFICGVFNSSIVVGETPWHLYFADRDMATTFFMIFHDNYLRTLKERQQTIRNNRRDFKKLCRQILK